MMSTRDPIELLTQLRPEAPEADPLVRADARDRLADASVRPTRHGRRRLVAAAALGAIAVVAIAVIAFSPWAHTQTAEAAVDDLVKTAATQPTVKIGPHDWIVTRYSTLRSWTQNLTQEKLDRMSANTADAAEAASGSSLHFGRSSVSKAEQAKIDRMNQRRIERIRAGVKISDLPATHITYTNEAPWTSARNAEGLGGGGGGNNEIRYGSPEEKAAGNILRRAGIGGIHSDPVDLGGFEISELPLRAVGDESDVEKLGDYPERMKAQLTKWKVPPGSDAKAGTPNDLFVKAAGVVVSPYATPHQRAAAIRLVAGLPGVELARSARDSKGREGVGMTLPIRGGRMQLVFDTDDARLLGMQTEVDDPKAFIGKAWAGSGHGRVRLLPMFDSATIGVSYEPIEVRDGPPCSKNFCVGAGADIPQTLRDRARGRAGSR